MKVVRTWYASWRRRKADRHRSGWDVANVDGLASMISADRLRRLRKKRQLP